MGRSLSDGQSLSKSSFYHAFSVPVYKQQMVGFSLEKEHEKKIL